MSICTLTESAKAQVENLCKENNYLLYIANNISNENKSDGNVLQIVDGKSKWDLPFNIHSCRNAALSFGLAQNTYFNLEFNLSIGESTPQGFTYDTATSEFTCQAGGFYIAIMSAFLTGSTASDPLTVNIRVAVNGVGQTASKYPYAVTDFPTFSNQITFMDFFQINEGETLEIQGNFTGNAGATPVVLEEPNHLALIRLY